MASPDAQKSAPSEFKPSDPAHPDQPNSDHTTSDGEKPTTLLQAATSASFFPTLDDAPLTTKLLSHSILLVLVSGGVFGAWFLGFEIFQVANDRSWYEFLGFLGGISVLGVGVLIVRISPSCSPNFFKSCDDRRRRNRALEKYLRW
jgi:hypothetical protein